MKLILLGLVCSLIFCSLFVILGSNPIYSLLALISCFFCLSGLLLLIGGDFFACCYLIIYVGAIAVLFLFVVMLLNIRSIEWQRTNVRLVPLSFFFIGICFLQFLIGLLFFEFDLKNSFNFLYFYLISFDFFFLIFFGINFFNFWFFFQFLFFSLFFYLWIFCFWILLTVFNYFNLSFYKNFFFNRIFIFKKFIFNLSLFLFLCFFLILFILLPFLYFNSVESSELLASLIFIELIFISNWWDFSNVAFLGSILYSYFGFFVIISGIILLIAMFGAIFLALSRMGDSFGQSIGGQMARHSSVFLRNL